MSVHDFWRDLDRSTDPWAAAMREGDFARAWEINDAVLRQRLASGEPCWHWPRHLQYVWNGDPLAGRRVLVRCYHGLGDTVQFIRFAAPLRRIAREVIVWTQPTLLSLIATAPGVDRVLPLHDGIPEADFDLDIELMEVPYALRTVPKTLPRDVPYVSVLPSCPRARCDGRPRVGVVWAAGDWDRRRSLPARLTARLARIPGLHFLSLQRGPARNDLGTTGMEDASTDDAVELARVIKGLDLVISVDTMVAHLAGALGAPVWTLLHADCDWRWMQNRTDSPWYPTMRLFRQPHSGNWAPVVEAVSEELRRRFASHGSGRT
jgi:hypothetical protein